MRFWASPCRERGNALEFLALVVLDLLDILLKLPQVNLAIRDSLLAARELGQLPVDVVLLGEHALLDLQHLVAALAQLGLELGAELDRLLARLDRGLAAGRFSLALCLVEDQRPRASSRFEP